MKNYSTNWRENKMYILYPNIISRIKKTLKKLNLEVLNNSPENFVGRKMRFYYAFCKTKNGEKVFFKTLLKKEDKIKNRFLNEINLLKTLKENPSYPLSNFAPEVLDFSLSPSFPYLLYKFLPGESKERKDNYTKGEIKKIVNLLKVINSSPPSISKFITEKPFFEFSQYKKRVSSLLKTLPIEPKMKLRIANFIDQNKETFYTSKPVLSHGDFSEANLVFFKNKVRVIDWEHVHLRNPLYDFVSFFVKRRKRPQEQKEFKKLYLKTGVIKNKVLFSNLFKLVIVEIYLRDLIFFQEELKILRKKGKTDKDKIVKIAIKSIEKEVKETLKLLKKEFPKV